MKFVKTIGIVASLIMALAVYVAPFESLAQSNCKAEFKLYHPNAPTGSIDLRVDDMSTPVQMQVKIPASSLGFFPCGKNARFLYSWNKGSDNFVLNQGATEKSLNLTTAPNGAHTIKFQTNNTQGSNSFDQVYQERTVKLTVGKSGGVARDGGGRGDSGGGGGTAQEGAGYVAREYDGVDWEGALSIKNPSGTEDISGLVTKLINWLLMIIAMVATVVIIYSGLLLVFNGGNEGRIKSAKTTLTWAVVGLIVSVSAFALVNIVESLL